MKDVRYPNHLQPGSVFHLKYGDTFLNRFVETDVIMLQPCADLTKMDLLRVSDLKQGIWRPFSPKHGELFYFSEELARVDLDKIHKEIEDRYKKMMAEISASVFDSISQTPDLLTETYVDGVECNPEDAKAYPHQPDPDKTYPVKEGSAERNGHALGDDKFQYFIHHSYMCII